MNNRRGIKKDHPPEYIYYTECRDSNGKFVECRVSFVPNQYWQLASIYKKYLVTCKRMNVNTGIWEVFKRPGE